MYVGNCIDWYRLIFHKRHTVVCVPIQPVMVLIWSVMVLIRPFTVLIQPFTALIWLVSVPIQLVTLPIQPVTVHLARRGFQDSVVYCFMHPTLCTLLYCNQDYSQCIVSYTIQALGPPSMNYLMHSTDLPVCVFSVTRAVVSLLPNILWCHLLLAMDILFPWAITTAKFTFLFCGDKHIGPERKVIMYATFVVYVRSIESLDIDLFFKPGLFVFFWKKALKHSKEYFVSGRLKHDKVPGNGVFHTLDLEKAFCFRGLGPLTPSRVAAPGPHQGPQKAPRPHIQTFWLSSIPVSAWCWDLVLFSVWHSFCLIQSIFKGKNPTQVISLKKKKN